MTKAQRRKKENKRTNAWKNEHCRQFAMRFFPNTDAEVIAKLEDVPNKTDYIRQLILADLKKERKTTTMKDKTYEVQTFRCEMREDRAADIEDCGDPRASQRFDTYEEAKAFFDSKVSQSRDCNKYEPYNRVWLGDAVLLTVLQDWDEEIDDYGTILTDDFWASKPHAENE